MANLVTDPNLSNTGYWTRENLTSVTGGQTDSAGGSNAYRLLETTANAEHGVQHTFTVAAAAKTYRASVKVRGGLTRTWCNIIIFQSSFAAGVTEFFQLSGSGSIGSGGYSYGGIAAATNRQITSLGSGWYEIRFDFTSLASATDLVMGLRICNGDGGEGYAGNTANGLYYFDPILDDAAGAVTGTISATLGMGAAMSGGHGVRGPVAATLGLAAAMSGTHIPPVAGTLGATLGLGASLSGAHGVSGSAASTLALTAALTGSYGDVTATLAATLDLRAALQGQQSTGGPLAATLRLSMLASGLHAPVIDGDLAATLTMRLIGAGVAGVEREEKRIPVVNNLEQLRKNANAILADLQASRPTYGGALPDPDGIPDGVFFVQAEDASLHQMLNGAWVLVSGGVLVMATVPISQTASSGDEVPYATEIYDRRGEYDPTTHTFTPLRAGRYRVHAMLVVSNLATTRFGSIEIDVNGVRQALGPLEYNDAGTSRTASFEVSRIVNLAAGDDLTIKLSSDNGSALTLFDAPYSFLEIEQV